MSIKIDLCRFLIICLYLYYQGYDSINHFYLSTFVCQDLNFHLHMLWSDFVFGGLKWKVEFLIITDRLNFLFIIILSENMSLFIPTIWSWSHNNNNNSPLSAPPKGASNDCTLCNKYMKPCNITSRSLIIARLSNSNKSTAEI